MISLIISSTTNPCRLSHLQHPHSTVVSDIITQHISPAISDTDQVEYTVRYRSRTSTFQFDKSVTNRSRTQTTRFDNSVTYRSTTTTPQFDISVTCRLQHTSKFDYRLHCTYEGYSGGRRGRHRMVVGFTTTYAISAYHHLCCEI